MTFQKSVLIVAFVLLVITSIIVFIMLYFSKNQYQFPPNVSKCPDYWVISPPTTSEQYYTCNNKAQLKNNASYTFNGVANKAYEPVSAEILCELKRDLNTNKITWTGISNNQQICNFSEDID